MTVKSTLRVMAVILLPVFANAQTPPAPQPAASAPQPAASGSPAQGAAAAANQNKKEDVEKPSGEEHVSVTLKIYRWSFANSISMPDFGTGIISSRRTAADDTNLWYKSDGKWRELNIAPRQMKTIKYEGPKNMRFAKRKENPPNPDKPEADENFSSAGLLNIPISSGDLFALMLKTGSNARFYPMNISPQQLPRNKFAVMNMTRQSVAFNINGQTSIIGPGKSFIFSPKKKDGEGITCQIAKRIKGKWVACYKNIISLPDDSRTMLLVYDPANKSSPRYNVQVLNLR